MGAEPDRPVGRREPVGAVARPPSGSFPDFYRECYSPMLRLAALLVGSLDAAHDVVQDSFLSLYRHWPRVDEPQAYLRRVVVNTSRSQFRRRAREARLRDRLGWQLERVEVVGGDELGDALARLPYRQRAALVLRFYEDLSEAETAQALGCRPGTVGSLVSRGIAELRRVVER